MVTIPAATIRGDLRRSDARPSVGFQWKDGVARQTGGAGTRREAALNWLALGLLLAAWNVSNDDPTSGARPRPASLRGHPFVSVRTASLHAGVPGPTTEN